MTRVTIGAPPGKPDNVTICVDECPIPGIARYRLEQEAGKLAVLSLEIIMLSGDVDLPDVVVQALDVTPDAQHDAATDTAHPALDEFARLRRDAYPALERQAIAGTQLEGVDVTRLAERYVNLTPERRDAVRVAVGLRPSTANEPISDAFSLAHQAGKLKEFDAAVWASLQEQAWAALRGAAEVINAGLRDEGEGEE